MKSASLNSLRKSRNAGMEWSDQAEKNQRKSREIPTIAPTSAKYETNIGNPCMPAINVSGINRSDFMAGSGYHGTRRRGQKLPDNPTAKCLEMNGWGIDVA